LIKYLSSLGYRKDGSGVLKLSSSDIENLENGISSIVELKNPLERKLYQFFGEYQLYKNNSDPNGLSYLQRIEHLKTGWLIFKEHPFIGVGTGDVQTSFDEMYLKESSNLDEEHRLRAHSQVLTFMISFGFFGGVLLFLVLFVPFFNQKVSYLQVVFGVSIICSFAFSDLLETQVGVTFFAFFYTLFNLKNKVKALE
jgi:O-antigen ligase